MSEKNTRYLSTLEYYCSLLNYLYCLRKPITSHKCVGSRASKRCKLGTIRGVDLSEAQLQIEHSSMNPDKSFPLGSSVLDPTFLKCWDKVQGDWDIGYEAEWWWCGGGGGGFIANHPYPLQRAVHSEKKPESWSGGSELAPDQKG